MLRILRDGEAWRSSLERPRLPKPLYPYPNMYFYLCMCICIYRSYGFMYLYVYTSIYLSIYLSIYPSIRIYIYISLYMLPAPTSLSTHTQPSPNSRNPQFNMENEPEACKASLRKLTLQYNPDPWADPTSRFPSGFHNLHHRNIRAQN